MMYDVEDIHISLLKSAGIESFTDSFYTEVLFQVPPKFALSGKPLLVRHDDCCLMHVK